MSNKFLGIYHRLPPPLQNIIASIKGYKLQSWRYSRETNLLVEQALEREQWSPKKWRNWQEEKVIFILNRAARKVPYYRELWNKRRRKGDKRSIELLENWPILEKNKIRENPKAFISDDCSYKKMFHVCTSGTTGTPLNLWRSRNTDRSWYALFEARSRGWGGVSRYDWWGILGGQFIISGKRTAPPFWVCNKQMKQIYFSNFHLQPETAMYYFEAIKKYKLKYLYGYASSLNLLATEFQRLKVKTKELGLKAIITNAEPLLDVQRVNIENVFECFVQETYGMAEMVMGASECREHTLHVWPEVGYIEVLDEEDKIIKNQQTGSLIGTGLLNQDMPLIRYRVGDRGKMPNYQSCSCGRTLPSITKVEGRSNDLLITKEGKKIFWINPIFYGQPVKEAQVIQESLDYIKILYIPEKEFCKKNNDYIVTELKQRMGSIRINMQPVDKIQRDPNGKFRSVVCKVKDRYLLNE